MLRRVAPAVALVAILLPCVFARAASPSAVRLIGPLRVVGARLVEGTGRPVRLQGVAVESLDVYPYTFPHGPLSDADIATAQSWGANVIRVALSQHFWNADDCGYTAYSAYRATVQHVVDAITGRGMVALLDLHYSTRLPCLPPGEQPMADPGSVVFWHSVAEQFRGNPLVAFDLFNEPNVASWDLWLHGGLVADRGGFGVPILWRAVGMQTLYDVVRSTGATNLVVVSGNHYANDPPPPAYLVQGTNIAYAVHAYTCPYRAPPHCATVDPLDPSPELNRWLPLLGQAPVLLTEFGWPDPSAGQYMSNAIKWAQQHGVGWTAFDFNNSAPGPNFGLFVDHTSYTPTGTGRAVIDGLGRPAA